MSGDMVRRPGRFGDWYMLAMSADSLEFSGSWCRRTPHGYDIRPSDTRFPQDGQWSTLVPVRESL
jgi:hypothetical protein